MAEESKAESGEASLTAAVWTVAIVDDDESIRKSLSRFLQVGGMRGEAFSSAAELFSDGRLDRWDCLVLDVRMPGTNGLELAAQLRERGWDTPVIFISGFNDLDARAKAREVGAVAFLLKPFDARSLLETIGKSLT